MDKELKGVIESRLLNIQAQFGVTKKEAIELLTIALRRSLIINEIDNMIIFILNDNKL